MFYQYARKGSHCLLLFLLFFLLSETGQAQSWAVLKAKADSIENTGQVSASYTAYKRLLTQAAAEFGTQHKNYGESLYHLGALLVSKGQDKAAEDTLLLAQQIFEKAGPSADTLLGLTYNQQAVCYRRQNQFKSAETLYLRALTHWEKVAGKDGKECNWTKVGLGNLYTAQTQPDKALPFFLEALAYQRKTKAFTPVEHGILLNSLATVYNLLDQPDKAEPLLIESLAVRRRINHPQVSGSLNSLAILYDRMGESEKALGLYKEAVSLITQQQPGSIEQATMVQNMALCAGNMGMTALADSLYQKTLAIYHQLGFIRSVSYAATLQNLALLRYAHGQISEAQKLFDQARELVLAINGSKNILYARLLFNAGASCLAAGNYAEADSLLKEGLYLNDSLAGPSSLDHAQMVMARSVGWYKTGQLGKAITGFDEGIELYRRRLQRHFLYASTSQKDAYLGRWSSASPLYYTVSQQHPDIENLPTKSYAMAMFFKNLLLNEQHQLANLIHKSTDSRMVSQFDSVQQLTRLLIQQYNFPLSKRLRIDSLEAAIEVIEKTIARQSAPFRVAQQTTRANWRDVQAALKPNEAAIEFVHFRYHNGHKPTDSTLYMALVLRPGWKAPRLVQLTHEKAIARLLQSPSINLTASLLPLRAKQQTPANTGQLMQGQALYTLLWQPIDSLLRGAKQVWVSPSGLLHKVALGVLPYTGNVPGKVLADQYTIRYVNTTRAILTATPTYWTTSSRAQLYGGIDYATDTLGHSEWAPLPGTLNEVLAIKKLLGSSATIMTGSKATRRQLMEQPAANVLHLATHSFFLSPDSIRTDYIRQAAERTLRRSGIVLAGANQHSGEESGILSGQELASLDLTQTNLVVLSGCETGLGDIRGSEGVFGLQRAAKMAGAKNLLMSLWPVPDGPTSQFMEAFYQNWKQPGRTLQEAFAQTQRQLRKQYPPAVWAAFVLVE